MRLRWFLLSPVWLTATSPVLSGQPLRELEGPGCGTCIRVTRQAVLGPVPGVSQPAGTDPRLARDSRGRVYFVDDLLQGRIFVFDATGAFVRTLGRPGNAPGEFQIIKHLMVGERDALHVFDDALRRHTILNRAGKVVGTTRYPGSNRGLILRPDNRVVVSRLIHARDQAGLPLHVSNDTGGIARSFGNPSGYWRSDFPQVLARSICSTGGDDIWAAHFTQYVVEHWTSDGTLRESLGRSVPWFEPWIQPDARIGEAPPQPRLTSIACESPRRLWITALVADNHWKTGLGVRRGERGNALTVADPNRYYDTVLEVIDPVSGTVLASRRVDEALYELFVPGYAWAARPRRDSTRQFEIWRVQFLPQMEGKND